MRPIPYLIAATVALVGCDSSERTEIAQRALGNALSGAIFTTVADGTSVNANIYADREDVYLDGGPGPNAPASAAGLPAGDYFFQVTDPSGQDLLSSDHVSCRMVRVDTSGVIDHSYPGTNYVLSGPSWVATPCQHLTGVDVDHDATTVQLYPYDKTPNKGGVYKVWMTPVADYAGDPSFVPTRRKDSMNGEDYQPNNYHGFVPADSKTDNYKVEQNGPPFVPPQLVVKKFHDANANGSLDAGESFFEGWGLTVVDPLGSSNQVFTTFSTFVDAGTWLIEEDTLLGVLQTVSFLDGAIDSLQPSANPLVAVEVAGDSGETHEVVYGNVATGSLSACKVYDRNANGSVDSGEPTIAGWRFSVAGTTTSGATFGPVSLVAGADGCASLTNLLPGSYTVTELMPTGDEWFATGELSQTFTIVSSLSGSTLSATAAIITFTNACETAVDFGTKGYWHNKNGLDEMSDADIDFANSLLPYAAPSEYFESGDEPFDGLYEDNTLVDAAFTNTAELLAGAGTARAEVSQFLVENNGQTVAREQLAQQLLAFVFNVLNRAGGTAAGIQLPDGSWSSAADLISTAILAWDSGSDAERLAIKTVLDTLNNGDAVAVVPAQPCTVAY